MHSRSEVESAEVVEEDVEGDDVFESIDGWMLWEDVVQAIDGVGGAEVGDSDHKVIQKLEAHFAKLVGGEDNGLGIERGGYEKEEGAAASAAKMEGEEEGGGERELGGEREGNG